MKAAWHEDERFWEETAFFQFSERAWIAAKDQVEAIIKLLGLAPGMRILDMPCGPGRHALEFARRGFQVTGVDLTSAFIAQARERAEKEGLSAEFLREDMRKFQRKNFYDVGLNLFTSLGYFDDPAEDKKVLENFFSSLRPGGLFLIDVRGKETLARDFRPRDWREQEGALILEQMEIIEGWSRVRTRWIVIKNGERKEFVLTLRLYSGAELKRLLEDVGFGEVQLFGDFSGNPYGPEARRLIAVGRKNMRLRIGATTRTPNI